MCVCVCVHTREGRGVHSSCGVPSPADNPLLSATRERSMPRSPLAAARRRSDREITLLSPSFFINSPDVLRLIYSTTAVTLDLLACKWEPDACAFP